MSQCNGESADDKNVRIPFTWILAATTFTHDSSAHKLMELRITTGSRTPHCHLPAKTNTIIVSPTRAKNYVSSVVHGKLSKRNMFNGTYPKPGVQKTQ